MSSNNEFPIPFEDSRRGLAANQEEKAAVGRLGQYLASRGVNRPTIGEGRKKRRLGNIELPTGGKPGKRNPTGSRMDVDGDGWADEGTTKPVWVGIDGQGKKPKQGTEGPKPSSSSSKRKLSSGFYNLIAIETDESTPEKLESLKEQLGDALVSHETSTVDIGARGKSNVRKKHTFRIDNSGLRNTYAHNYATNRGFVAQIEAAPSETRLSSGMTQLSEVEVYNYGKLKAAKKVRSTQPKGKEQDYWIVLGIDGDVRAYSASVVEEKRKKLLDNFNQQGENPFNGKKSPLSIDDIDMQDVLRGALDDQKIKIIASMETWDVEDRNEVFQINTRDGHRRRGIAAEMFNTHREVFPERDLQHSDALSEDGKAFSAATPATSVSGRFSSGRDINAKLNLERYGDNEESAYVSSFEIGSKKFSVSRGGDSPGRNMYNGYLVAFDDDGKNVGYIDYNSDSVDKTATVAMTEVAEEYKRMGVASALLDSLLIDLPGYEISPGYTTDEGSAWWRRVTGGDGPIKAERNTRLSSGAARRYNAQNIYDESVDYNDKRNPSELLETSRDGKEYSSIRFNGDGYDIKTSQSEDGFSVFIEDESGQIASLTFSEPPTGEATKLLSYNASKESQKAGVLEALLDHVLVKNPDTNITSSAETRRWFNYVNNGTADYGAKRFRKYGFFAKYSDGEDVLRDGDYTFESDLLLKTSNVSSSPVVEEGFTPKEYIWTGQVFKIGNESIVFGAHEEAEFNDEEESSFPDATKINLEALGEDISLIVEPTGKTNEKGQPTFRLVSFMDGKPVSGFGGLITFQSRETAERAKKKYMKVIREVLDSPGLEITALSPNKWEYSYPNRFGTRTTQRVSWENQENKIKKLPLNPFEILKLDPSSAEGRKAAKKWYAAVHGADVSVLAESSDFNASSYVSALLYAASKGDKDAQKEFDEFAKYSDSLLEKLDSKLPAVDNPEKALSLDARMIHQTSYKPTIDEKGYLVLRPLEDFPQTAKDGTEVTVNRTTLHFAVNHLAEGHLFRKETEGESYVVIAPLDSFIKENPDSLENFNIVDTAASPPPGDGLRFPPGSYKLVEVKEGEDGRKKVEDILRADGIEVLAGGERNSGTPGADEAGRIRAQMLGVSPNVASDLTLANLEQVNRTHISAERRYADVPSSTSFFQEASKNALLRIANRKENTWVSTSRKLNDKDPLSGSATRLASGRAPRYPREPTLGAFLEGAEERFDGVNSWEEFRERYADTEMVFLDYETTGLDFDEFGKATTNGNPTQIGLVRMKNGKEIGRLNLFMNPEQPLGEWSLANLKDADGNPITNEWLATQMPMAEAHRQVAEFIGPNAIIGVQNATFDKRVLEDALEREGIDWRPSGYLDTRDISAMTLPVWSEESPEGPYVTDRDGNKKPSSSLAAITEYLDVELGDGHHNADADAFATSQVMQKIIDRAIENGWSTDVLDREKRDSKLKADNDKFNADAEKFELDKEAFVAERDSVDSAGPPSERSRETSEANTVVELGDVFKRPLRPIRPRSRPKEKLTSTEARLVSEDALYDEAYGPRQRNNRRGTRMPSVRGVGETEYDAMLEMVDLGRRRKKLKKASFSYGIDEFERTLQWTENNADREVDIKIMSQELEIPLSNAYFFIAEFPEVFERLKSENKRRQKYRIRTPQEIKNYSEESSRLSSGKNKVITFKDRQGVARKIQVSQENLYNPEYRDVDFYFHQVLDAVDKMNKERRPGEPVWEIPTTEALLAMYKNIEKIGGDTSGEYWSQDYVYGENDEEPKVKLVNFRTGRVINESQENTARVRLISSQLPSKDDSKFDGPPTTRKLNAFIKDSGISVSRMTQDNEGSVSFNIPLKGKNSDDDAYEFVRKLESWAWKRQLDVEQENEFPADTDWSSSDAGKTEWVKENRSGYNVRVYDRLASGANVVEAFNEPTEVTQQEAAEAGSNRETLTGKKVAERIIQKIEETTGTTLTDQQKRTIENDVPGLTREIAGKTLLDVEIDDAFSETGKQLLESISIDISSDGIPFVSADPIPQLAEQIPDKRDWRTVELPKRDDVLSILEEAMKDTLVFEDSVWKDADGNIVARQIYKNETDGSVLEYENDEAKARFPMLEMIAPKGYVIRSDDIGLRALAQDRLPAPYLEAWKKHGQFLRELSRRAGELMGDEELFVPGSRINTSTSTYLRGYIGGITDPNKFNMGLDGRALQASHDLFGHLGTGRAFDRHGEWANDLAMMSIVDHPDSPLTPQEKLAVKHLTYMMYSAQRMLHTGRLDEQEQNQRESESFRNRPRSVFDITDMTTLNEGGAIVRVYAGDFDSVIKKFDAVSTSKRLSSGRKSIYEADAKDVELALAHDVLGKNDRLASGRVRESIPMNVPSKREQGDSSATRYGTQGSSGKIVRRDSSTWLSGLNSDEISRVIIPANAEEYFEMWADDIAGPTWRTDKNRETFIKKYYAELQKDPTNIPVDYSPESIAATQKLVKDLLDSSPSVMWVMQNFGAPLIVPFTREGMDAYENSPDMKERLALLAKQRGTEKIPFVSGLANRSLGSIGISPRALIDRESLLNDDKGVYPISFDPDRVPAPRDAHIDRSLEGTLVHEFGHWIHHRALWDTETNGASGKMRSYFGTGKLSDARYAASLGIAEEYEDYDTDDKRMEIYSQFIDLTGRSPEEMFRAHPDEPLLSTSYGNINKREALAEAFVAIMHPNKEMPEKTLSKKLRKDIYTLIGVDEKDLPWSDSETGSENRLSSGAKKGKRKNIFSRFRKEETEEETVEEIVEEKRKPPVVERPEGLVSFAPEPSQELLKASPIPDEETLRDEVLKDVQALALEFDGVQEPELFGSGTKASALAKKTIAANLSRSVDFDVQEFINVFATDKAGHGFHTTETFAAVQKLYKTLENLPVDATGTQRRAAARAAFDTKSGRVIAAKIHDDILDRARYYDEILDKLETEEFDELFGDSFDELMATDGGEKSLFTPYLMTKLGTIDIRREFLEEIEPRRGLLNRLIEAVTLIEDKAFGLAKIGEINPNTGERDYEIISLLGRPVSSKAIDAMSSLDINDKDYLKKLSDIMPEFKYQLTLEKLKEIVESEIVKVDSSSINSPEVQKALKEHLLRNVRSRAGNYDSKLESYTKETGVVFFDVETTEGKRIVREALVSDLIHTWAISANNANPVALSIQHEIRKMFGLDEAVGWSTSPIRARRLDEKEGMSAHEFDGAPELNDTQSAMIKLVLQKIYDSTQLYYKTKGITHIPVYRGFTQSDTNLLPGEIESMDTIMRPLSSWATSMDVASTFSGVHNTRVGTPTLIKTFVPVEDVFSNALTGFGCLNEDEVVLFGKPMRVLAVRMDSIQPESVGSIEKPTLLEILKDVNIANIDKAFESIAQRKETLLDNSDLIEELFNSGSDLRGMDLRNTLLDDKKLAGANLAGANMQYSRLNRIDLSNADLTGAVLEDTNLFMANLSGANLTDADLARANMLQANLTGANLTGASMIKASMKETDLTGANLTRASMKDADLTGAKLVDADLTEANLTGADLFLANLEGVNLEGANLNLTQLASANLQNANMRRAILVGANLLGADLRGADLSNANMTNITLLRGANLEGANLSGANLQGADLADVNLTGANLTGANLEGAKLQGANLDGVKLDGANLTGAILFSAKLKGASLKLANLHKANLRGADLEGVDLRGLMMVHAKLDFAVLTDANLDGADLFGVQFEDANLTRATLKGARMASVYLLNANLTGADLTGVELRDSVLRGANLTGANLTGADLSRTKLDGANLTGAKMPEGYIPTNDQPVESVQKLSSGKKSHTPKWKTVEEIVDFEVLGASPDDSEEDRDDIVKESVGGDWMQWDPCREIRTAAYELAGIDEYSERDPNISQSGGFFGNSKFETAVSPEKRTEQARYLMASIVDSLINKGRYEKQPYLYRAMMFSSPEEGKQFFDAMQVGSQIDIPLLAFVEIGPSPRGDHFLTRFGSDALLVLEDFPGSYQTGGTFEPIFSSRHESDTLYNINEFAEAILADIENGEVDEESAEYDKEFAEKLIKLVEDYREAKTPLERSNIKIDLEEALDEVGNETIKREWEGEPLPEDHEEYYDAMEDEDTGMTPREFVSGGRLEVVSVKPDTSKAYRQIITLRQVGAFDPQEKGALVLKTDGENGTRLLSGKKPAKKAKPKSVQLKDDEFEKKFNQKVPEGNGDCFSEAIQQARKLAEAYDKVKIVHGYPLGTGGEAEGLRFPHAWAEFERDGLVWVRDYSNGNRIEFPQILYYGIGNIEEADVSRYDIKEAEANMIENEHYGPW